MLLDLYPLLSTGTAFSSIITDSAGATDAVAAAASLLAGDSAGATDVAAATGAVLAGDPLGEIDSMVVGAAVVASDSAHIQDSGSIYALPAWMPDAAALRVTNDLDVRALITIDGSVPVNPQVIAAKWDEANANSAWRLELVRSGSAPWLRIGYNTTGSGAGSTYNGGGGSLTAMASFFGTNTFWIRATYSSTASFGFKFGFYVSVDGTTWYLMGANNNPTSALFSSTAPITFGGVPAGSLTNDPLTAAVLSRVVVKHSSTSVLDVDFSTMGANLAQTVESVTGALVGRTRSANGPYFSGVALHGTGLSGPGGLVTPDSTALSITGDLDLRAFVAPDSYSGGSTQTLLAKWATGTDHSYRFLISSSGFLQLNLSSTGVNTLSTSSSAVVGFGAGEARWLRATWRASDGRVQFFTSTDGSAWTQLGTDRSIVAGSIFDSAVGLEIGSGDNGVSNPFLGRIYRAQVYNGIAGTLAFDANFTSPQPGDHLMYESANSAPVVFGFEMVAAEALAAISDTEGGSDATAATVGVEVADLAGASDVVAADAVALVVDLMSGADLAVIGAEPVFDDALDGSDSTVPLAEHSIDDQVDGIDHVIVGVAATISDLGGMTDQVRADLVAALTDQLGELDALAVAVDVRPVDQVDGSDAIRVACAIGMDVLDIIVDPLSFDLEATTTVVAEQLDVAFALRAIRRIIEGTIRRVGVTTPEPVLQSRVQAVRLGGRSLRIDLDEMTLDTTVEGRGVTQEVQERALDAGVGDESTEVR